MALVKLLGETVVDNKGNEVAVASLANKKAIGLYFSAHWCGPCRAFTPVFAKAYRKLKAEKDFEVIFLSSDHSPAEFKSYFAEHPWLALPFEDRNTKNRLSKKFKVQGIPSLIILDPVTGKPFNTNGRNAIVEDPNGDNFPWIEKPFLESLPAGSVVKGDGAPVDIASLRGCTTLGVYFSAHWCPPCKQFTPVLTKLYNELKEKNAGFEVVYVSLDKNRGQFNSYFAEMPWLAVDYANEDLRQEIASQFGVSGIPTLCFMDPATGEVYSENGVGLVSNDPAGKDFPWKARSVNPLIPAFAADLNQKPSLIVFSGDSNPEPLVEILNSVATSLKDDAKGKDDDDEGLALFYAPANPISERVRVLFGQQDTPVVVAILDIPGAEAFAIADISKLEDVNSGALLQFARDFLEGKVQLTPLGG